MKTSSPPPTIGPLKYPVGFQLEGLHPARPSTPAKDGAAAFPPPLSKLALSFPRPVGQCSEGSNQGEKTQRKLLSINDTQTFQLPSGFVFNLWGSRGSEQSIPAVLCTCLHHQMGRKIRQGRKYFGCRKCPSCVWWIIPHPEVNLGTKPWVSLS